MKDQIPKGLFPRIFYNIGYKSLSGLKINFNSKDNKTKNMTMWLQLGLYAKVATRKMFSYIYVKLTKIMVNSFYCSSRRARVKQIRYNYLKHSVQVFGSKPWKHLLK